MPPSPAARCWWRAARWPRSAPSGPSSIRCRSSKAARYAMMAKNNRVSARLIAPPRGRILDRFGTVLAGNKLNWRALLIAEQTDDVDGTLDNFSRLVPLADHERARIERELRRHRRFIPVIVREFLDLGGHGADRGERARTCPASWSMSAPRGCIRSARSWRMSSATWRRRARPISATIRMLSLAGHPGRPRGHREIARRCRCAAAPARCSSR